MNKARRKEIEALIDELEDLKSRIESVQSDEQDYFDNMPENLQSSERGELAEEAVGNLDSALDSLDEAIESLREAMQ